MRSDVIHADRLRPVVAGVVDDGVVVFGGVQEKSRTLRLDAEIISDENGSRRLPPAPFPNEVVAADALVTQGSLYVAAVQCVDGGFSPEDGGYHCRRTTVDVAAMDIARATWRRVAVDLPEVEGLEPPSWLPQVRLIEAPGRGPIISYSDERNALLVGEVRDGRVHLLPTPPIAGELCADTDGAYVLQRIPPRNDSPGGASTWPEPPADLAVKTLSWASGSWRDLDVPELARRDALDDPRLACAANGAYLVHTDDRGLEIVPVSGTGTRLRVPGTARGIVNAVSGPDQFGAMTFDGKIVLAGDKSGPIVVREGGHPAPGIARVAVDGSDHVALVLTSRSESSSIEVFKTSGESR